MSACGAYAIRPYTGDLKNGDFSIHSTTAVAVCGAYAVAPYTGDLKNGDFSIHSTSGMSACGAYAIRPYTGTRKNGDFFSIRPPVWPSMGRMLLRPTRTDENRAGFWFVFRGGAEKGAGRGLCEKWGRRASIIIRRLLPLRARRRMGPIIASAHAFIIPNYVA